jgi:hypothetical protein
MYNKNIFFTSDRKNDLILFFFFNFVALNGKFYVYKNMLNFTKKKNKLSFQLCKMGSTIIIIHSRKY